MSNSGESRFEPVDDGSYISSDEDLGECLEPVMRIPGVDGDIIVVISSSGTLYQMSISEWASSRLAQAD